MSPDPQPQFQNSVDVKLDYIQRDVRQIQVDISVIRNDFVSRREFTEAIKELKETVAFLQKIIFGFIGLIVVGVLTAIFKLVIK